MESPSEGLVALPPVPPTFAGSTTSTSRNCRIIVSNKAGYLCHIHVQSSWTAVAPEVLFAILTHPDNSTLLRDMKRVGERKIIKAEPGFKELHVIKCTKVRELWRHRFYKTCLHVIEDSRDPECLSTSFDLVNSEYFIKFSGRWELRPVRDPATGAVVGCHGELQQDVLPKGVPRFLTRMPLVGAALRNISIRAISRLLADLQAAADKVMAGHASGLTTEQVLWKLCGPSAEDGCESTAEDVCVPSAEDGCAAEPAPPSPNSLMHQASVESATSASSDGMLDAAPMPAPLASFPADPVP